MYILPLLKDLGLGKFVFFAGAELEPDAFFKRYQSYAASASASVTGEASLRKGRTG